MWHEGRKWAGAGLAVMLALHALGNGAFASVPVAVPEINPGSISAGLALLAGGVLMLRARRRRR
jgi:LPXTG-motif cell wall-anchored protein